MRHFSRQFTVAAIVALAMAGAWVSGTLLAQHDGGWTHGKHASGPLWSLCESKRLPSASCTDVVGSRWGSFDFYLGSRRVYVPTSLVGVAYFTSVAIWFAMVGSIPGRARRLWRLTFLLVTCGLAGSLGFLALMAFALPAWCVLCLVAHALNLAIFISTCILWRNTRCAGESEPATSRVAFRGVGGLRVRLAGWAVVTIGAASLGLWLYTDAVFEARRQWRKQTSLQAIITAMTNDRAFVLREYFAQPQVLIPPRVDEDSGAGDPADTLLPRLVVFTNYNCSGCVCFELWRTKTIDSAFDGRLRVEIRHAPPGLATADQPGLSDLVRVQDDEVRASLAAEAARAQGGEAAFETMHRLLFARPKRRAGRDYAVLARRAGLHVDRFADAMDSEPVRRRVLADATLAAELQINGTPTVFLDGRRVPDLCLKSEVFWQAVATRLLEPYRAQVKLASHAD